MIDQHRKFIDPLRAAYAPPTGPFDPDGEWALVYNHYCYPIDKHLASKRAPGRLRIARQFDDDGMMKLAVTSRRPGTSGYHFFSRVEFSCRADDLRTPIAWRATTKMAQKPTDKAYLNSGMEKHGSVVDGKLTIVTGNDVDTVDLPEHWSAKWCLFEAVQRMSRQGIEQTPTFTMIDEVDELHPNQTLRFLEATEIETKRGKVNARVYEQLGHGVVPTCYIVDDQGRLLVWGSGVEMLALAQVEALS